MNNGKPHLTEITDPAELRAIHGRRECIRCAVPVLVA
jgi:hypothetical protein